MSCFGSSRSSTWRSSGAAVALCAAACSPEANVAATAPPATPPPSAYIVAARQIVDVHDHTCTLSRTSRVGVVDTAEHEAITSTAGLVASTSTVVRFAIDAGPLELVIDADAAGLRVVRSAPLPLDGIVATSEGSCFELDATSEGSAGPLALASSIEARLCPEVGLGSASIVHRYSDANGEVALLTIVLDCENSSTAETP